MKLIIQIPCFNEQETLPETLKDLPTSIAGVTTIEIVVIDDCSTDETVAVANLHHVDHVVQNRRNLGLARSFSRGLDACLKLGADIIVNTDGDNQYRGADIEKLIRPILNKDADLVLGDRQLSKMRRISPWKCLLQRLGSAVVTRLSKVDAPDAVTGFRALSRDAALRINILSSFSYTTEMIIQAGRKNFAVVSVPIRTNPETRPSRLFKSVPDFIRKQMITILRMYVMYQPLKFFLLIGAVLGIAGSIPIARFIFYYFSGDGAGHIQSLVLGGVLISMSFISIVSAVVADVIAFNRQLIESVLEKTRLAEMSR